jgi:nitroreductase
MVGPGPSTQELDAILALAMRTPDHGKLAPWRFVVVGADQRGELSALLARALDANEPAAGDAHRHKAEEFARSGEALVVLLSAPVIPHKIPQWEQELSVGAAAMNLLHAVHAHGYVGSWLTGWAAYDPLVRDAFCLGPNEKVAGFFFIGSPGRPLEERPRPETSAVVRRWSPPL